MAVTITEQKHTSIRKIVFSWTSAADGTASGTTTLPHDGQLLGLYTVPGTAANQPTDQYDITIKDEDGLDVVNAQGANRSNVNNELVISSLLFVAGDKLTLAVENAGNAKSGTVYLWYR